MLCLSHAVSGLVILTPQRTAVYEKVFQDPKPVSDTPLYTQNEVRKAYITGPVSHMRSG